MLRLLRNTAGLAAMEFGLLAPFFLLLLLGGIEVSRDLIIHQKLSRTASSMANIVAMAPEISRNNVDLIMLGVEHLMDPYNFSENGRVIISSVGRRNGSAPTVFWQQAGAGDLDVDSRIGMEGGTASNLPNGFTLFADEDVIIAEVFYNFEPLVAPDIMRAEILYKTAVFRPRLGALDTLINSM